MERFLKRCLCAGALALAATSGAADLPTAVSIAAEMGMGWNNGNNMEVPSDPTAWGNQLPTQALIDSVKAAGFKTVRLPCAWYTHTESDGLTIKPAWMAQVRTIVDYCIKDSLFVILNSHWDNGWLESHITTNADSAKQINRMQGAYWRQIATAFKDYDRHLLFAGANEPAMQDAYGTAFGADRMAVLNSYYQTFIDSVRATGGNNATRTLVIQGPRTDIELMKAVDTVLPTDKVSGRLMVEAHFYPYQFTLMETDADWGKVFYYWGKSNLSTGVDKDRNTTWCGEAFVDSEFTILKRMFVDKGIPVIIGEFGAIKRTTLTGDTLERHLLSRRAFYEYVVSSAKAHGGIIPVAWDAGGLGDKTFSIFNRKTDGIFDLGLLNAMRSGMGMTKLAGDTSLVRKVNGSSALKVLCSAKDSGWTRMELGVVKPDFSAYDSIIVRSYVNGETNYMLNGKLNYGWVSLSLVTMSKNWTWREAHFPEVTMNTWTVTSFPIGKDTSVSKAMVPADPSKVDYFGLQAYDKGFHGTIYVDWIAFKKKDGTVDTLYTFDANPISEYSGNAESATLIPVDSVVLDEEWKKATSSVYGSTGIVASGRLNGAFLTASQLPGAVRVSWSMLGAGTARITLRDLSGRTLWTGSREALAGANSFDLPIAVRGLGLLTVQQNGQSLSAKVIGY